MPNKNSATPSFVKAKFKYVQAKDNESLQQLYYGDNGGIFYLRRQARRQNVALYQVQFNVSMHHQN